MSSNCKRAIKILEQYERLANKFGITIPPARLNDLNHLRDNGTIKSTDLPAKLRHEFPGEFVGMPLDAIREQCGM